MTGNETVLQYLTSVPAWYLATSVDDQPHVRPFSFAAEQDGKLWFCTATTKDVWEELLANQRFEATSWWPGHGWLILRGTAGLDDRVNDDIRQAGYDHLTGLGEHYDGPHDPTLVYFSVEDPQAWICNHDEWKPLAFYPPARAGRAGREARSAPVGPRVPPVSRSPAFSFRRRTARSRSCPGRRRCAPARQPWGLRHRSLCCPDRACSPRS